MSQRVRGLSPTRPPWLQAARAQNSLRRSTDAAHALAYENEYRGWLATLHQIRYGTCALWFTIVVGFIVHLFQLPLSCHPYGIFWRIFSLQNMAWNLLFLLANLAIFALRAKTVSARRQPQSLWSRIKSLLYSNPLHALHWTAVPLLSLAMASAFMGLADWSWNTSDSSIFPGVGLALGIVSFGMTIGIQAIWRDENALRFPSLKRTRAAQLKASLFPITRQSASIAAVFSIIWWVVATAFSPFVRYMFADKGTGLMILPITTAVKLFIICWCIGLCWNLAQQLLNIFLTEPVEFRQYLFFGLQDSTDLIAKTLAFSDLSNLSASDALRRRELYLNATHFLTPFQPPSVPYLPIPDITNPITDTAWIGAVKPPLSELTRVAVSLQKASWETLTVSGQFAWLTQLRPTQRWIQLVEDAHIAACSAEALSRLAVASLSEDERGVTQDWLPAIFTALLSLSSALEDYCITDALFIHANPTWEDQTGGSFTLESLVAGYTDTSSLSAASSASSSGAFGSLASSELGGMASTSMLFGAAASGVSSSSLSASSSSAAAAAAASSSISSSLLSRKQQMRPIAHDLQTHVDLALFRMTAAFYKYFEYFKFSPKDAARLQKYISFGHVHPGHPAAQMVVVPSTTSASATVAAISASMTR